ncbi:MAG: SRPBCC family protein [Dehalococcoidia bacterium]
MTRSVHAEIDIAAPPERVWGILTDFAAFPRWNPFVRRATGDLREGDRLTIGLRLFRGPLTTFKPTVTRVEPNRELRWLAHLLTPGLLDTVRIFRIVPQNDGSVRFIQHEDCTGTLAAPLFALGLGGRIRRGYLAMNRALKAQAERPSAE